MQFHTLYIKRLCYLNYACDIRPTLMSPTQVPSRRSTVPSFSLNPFSQRRKKHSLTDSRKHHTSHQAPSHKIIQYSCSSRRLDSPIKASRSVVVTSSEHSRLFHIPETSSRLFHILLWRSRLVLRILRRNRDREALTSLGLLAAAARFLGLSSILCLG